MLVNVFPTIECTWNSNMQARIFSQRCQTGKRNTFATLFESATVLDTVWIVFTEYQREAATVAVVQSEYQHEHKILISNQVQSCLINVSQTSLLVSPYHSDSICQTQPKYKYKYKYHSDSICQTQPKWVFVKLNQNDYKYWDGNPVSWMSAMSQFRNGTWDKTVIAIII